MDTNTQFNIVIEAEENYKPTATTITFHLEKDINRQKAYYAIIVTDNDGTVNKIYFKPTSFKATANGIIVKAGTTSSRENFKNVQFKNIIGAEVEVITDEEVINRLIKESGYC